MKTFIFFDLDNTIFSTKQQKVLPNTIKLIKKIAADDRYVLGFATGRGPHKVKMLHELADLFKIKIFMNGAVAYDHDELFLNQKIDLKDIESVLKSAEKHDCTVGFVCHDQEVVTRVDEQLELSLKGFYNETPKVDPLIHYKTDIYQIWLFANSTEQIDRVASENAQLRKYYWHRGGADLVSPTTNKVTPIKMIKQKYQSAQIICVGDGQNDIDMIDFADIGIAMGNSRFDELKEKADIIAPNIDLDLLYQVFLDYKIIDSDE